jgi:hypothetical protein
MVQLKLVLMLLNMKINRIFLIRYISSMYSLMQIARTWMLWSSKIQKYYIHEMMHLLSLCSQIRRYKISLFYCVLIIWCAKYLRCPPCKKIAPVFERLSKEHESLMFVKIDVDTNPIVSQEYKVQSIPTFYFLNGKRVVTEVSWYFYLHLQK